MSRSFHNKIARVNLTEGSIRVEEPGLAYLRRYMGGWNFIADTLLREVPQGADPLGAGQHADLRPRPADRPALFGRVAQRGGGQIAADRAALARPRWAATGARSLNGPGSTP